MKGIILAGGKGTRLGSLTYTVSKQLLPVYDKPMFYYPLSTLMLAGIRDIAIITQEENMAAYGVHFSSGQGLGIKLSYLVQNEPRGLPDAYLVADEWLAGSMSAMILGDNVFHGAHFQGVLRTAVARLEANIPTIFGSFVAHPERFGVPRWKEDAVGKPIWGCLEEIIEKPPASTAPSSYAVTGLYFLPGNATSITKLMYPSKRGELEIAHLLNDYIKHHPKPVHFEDLGRGFAWLDTGTVDALYMASAYIQSMQWQQGIDICNPYEVAWRNGWIKEQDYINSTGRRDHARRVAPFPT